LIFLNFPNLAFDLVLQSISSNSGNGNFGSLRALARDSPILFFADDAHTSPRSPPLIDLTGKGEPNLLLSSSLAQDSQQFPVSAPGLLLNHVIRMNNKTCQPASCDDQVYLLFPQVQRIVVEQIKQH